MKTALSKEQLKALNVHRGKLDTSSGKVFVKFVGAMSIDDRLFHGEIELADPVAGTDYDKFALQSVLAPEPKPKRSRGKGDTKPESAE